MFKGMKKKYRRRYYKKKSKYAKPIGKRVEKLEKRVLRFKPELKEIWTVLNASDELSVNTQLANLRNTSPVSCVQVPMGDYYNTRCGKEISVVSLEVRIALNFQNGFNNMEYARFTLFHIPTMNSNVPIYTDLYQTPTQVSDYVYNSIVPVRYYEKEYEGVRVLKDKVIYNDSGINVFQATTGSVANNKMNIHVKLRFKKPLKVTYMEADQSGSLGNTQKNAIFFMLYGGGTFPPYHVGYTRLRYYDA